MRPRPACHTAPSGELRSLVRLPRGRSSSFTIPNSSARRASLPLRTLQPHKTERLVEHPDSRKCTAIRERLQVHGLRVLSSRLTLALLAPGFRSQASSPSRSPPRPARANTLPSPPKSHTLPNDSPQLLTPTTTTAQITRPTLPHTTPLPLRSARFQPPAHPARSRKSPRIPKNRTGLDLTPVHPPPHPHHDPPLPAALGGGLGVWDSGSWAEPSLPALHLVGRGPRLSAHRARPPAFAPALLPLPHALRFPCPPLFPRSFLRAGPALTATAGRPALRPATSRRRRRRRSTSRPLARSISPSYPAIDNCQHRSLSNCMEAVLARAFRHHVPYPDRPRSDDLTYTARPRPPPS